MLRLWTLAFAAMATRKCIAIRAIDGAACVHFIPRATRFSISIVSPAITTS